MSDLEDVKRVGRFLPQAVVSENGTGHVALSVEGKGFAWTWMERIAPKKPRVARPDVLAVRVADALEKESLLASDERKFFTEPHYNGFPAVLVRLPEVGVEELEELLTDAWRTKAPKALRKDSDL